MELKPDTAKTIMLPRTSPLAQESKKENIKTACEQLQKATSAVCITLNEEGVAVVGFLDRPFDIVFLMEAFECYKRQAAEGYVDQMMNKE